MNPNPPPFLAFLPSALVLFCAPFSSAAVLNTIATSGYNFDVFYEAGLAPGDSFASNGKGISQVFGARAFFETNAYGNPARGFNASNTGVTTTTGNTANFNFQSFAGNNALFVTSNLTKSTLTMSGAETGYSILGFVASAANLGQVDLAEFTYTINYAGGGTQTGTFTVDDWGAASSGTDPMSGASLLLDGSASPLLSGTRASTTASGTPSTSTPFDGTIDAGGGPFRFYLAEVTTNSTAAVLSVDFTATKLDINGVRSGSLGDAALFGVLGSPIVVPEPSIAVLAAGACGAFGLLRRRK